MKIYLFCAIFSLNRPLGLFSLLFPMSVCVPVCVIAKTHFLLDQRLLVEECFTNIGMPSTLFFFGFWRLILKKQNLDFGYCKPAYCAQWGVSNGRVCCCGCWRFWQVTGDRWHASRITRHATHDIVTQEFFCLPLLFISVCFGIGSTIRIHWEFQSLLYAEYFFIT